MASAESATPATSRASARASAEPVGVRSPDHLPRPLTPPPRGRGGGGAPQRAPRPPPPPPPGGGGGAERGGRPLPTGPSLALACRQGGAGGFSCLVGKSPEMTTPRREGIPARRRCGAEVAAGNLDDVLRLGALP